MRQALMRPARKAALVLTLSLTALFTFTTVDAQLAGTPAGSTVSSRNADQRRGSFADLIEIIRPAVVNISSRRFTPSRDTRDNSQFTTPHHGWPGRNFRNDPEIEQFLFRYFGPQRRQAPSGRESRSLGSGFIIDSSGLVVTNHHVVAGADEIEVVLEDGRTLPAQVRGHGVKTDIALLEIESEETFPSVAFGDSSKARVGDWVIAIGNPFVLGGTTTAGIISARGRDINSGPYDDYIQIDAPINLGNSSGPLFDMAGKVIGINTAIFSPNGGSIGIGFAVPSEQAKNVVAQLRERGSVMRA